MNFGKDFSLVLPVFVQPFILNKPSPYLKGYLEFKGHRRVSSVTGPTNKTESSKGTTHTSTLPTAIPSEAKRRKTQTPPIAFGEAHLIWSHCTGC